MFRKVALAAAAAASLGVIGTADASGPTVAQIKAEIAKHRNNFVLANGFSYNGLPPGHGWLNLQYGGGRWASANGRLVTLESVKLDPRDPALSDVTETTINYTARTWSRAKSQRPTKFARPEVIDPLGQPGAQFRLIGVARIDGRQAYHFRSTYFPYGPDESVRSDVWLSTDQYYFIRGTHTTRSGKVIQRIDNRWLPRTPANLALLTTAVPSSFKQVPPSS